MLKYTAEQKLQIAVEALQYVERLRGIDVSDDSRAKVIEFIESEIGPAIDAVQLSMTTAVLRVLKGVQSAIENGNIPADFNQSGDNLGKLITTGLTQYDPRVAFQTALRSAYSAGRYERAQQTPEVKFFVYRTIGDGRVRDSHRALNGLALPKNDPAWKKFYPPNGWRCRCIAYAVNESGLDRLRNGGVTLQQELPDDAEKAIEPGFDYNPALEPDKLRDQLTKRLVEIENLK